MQPASAAGMFTFLIRTIRAGNDTRFTRLLQHMKVRDIQATGGLMKSGFHSLCQMLFRSCDKCDCPQYTNTLSISTIVTPDYEMQEAGGGMV